MGPYKSLWLRNYWCREMQCMHYKVIGGDVMIHYIHYLRFVHSNMNDQMSWRSFIMCTWRPLFPKQNNFLLEMHPMPICSTLWVIDHDPKHLDCISIFVCLQYTSQSCYSLFKIPSLLYHMDFQDQALAFGKIPTPIRLQCTIFFFGN